MILSRVTACTKIHFLHIGKTGGSAVKSVLEKYKNRDDYELIIHNHKTPINKVPIGEKVVFFLRDPTSRFISGFYSRKRKGRPRYNVEWTEVESKVFSVFDTPNQLALALSDSSSEYFSTALAAMNNIQHLKRYNYWYINREYMQSRLDDILYIGFQECLDENFEILKKILDIPRFESLPVDDISAHKNLQCLDKFICDDGEKALKDWYASDIEFVSFCKELMFSVEIKM